MNDKKTKLVAVEEEPGIARSWLEVLTHPGTLLHAFEEAFNSCIATRPWRRLLLFSPVLLVVFLAIGLIVYGRSLGRVSLIKRYDALAQAEIERINETAADTDAEQTTATTLMIEEKSSSYSDMLYRRLLHLNDQNARTRYVVAMQMSRSKRLSQARQLMEEIAPIGGQGYGPAHAWLAIDLLSRQPLSKDDQNRLMQHLASASEWEGISGTLLYIYAELLAGSEKRKEAFEIMRKAAEKDPKYQTKYALMAREQKMPKIANEVATAARTTLNKAIRGPNAQAQHYIDLTMLELTEDNLEVAYKVAKAGLIKGDSDNPKLKYLASEAKRLMYRKSIRKTEKGLEFNLNLLDEAMKEYPANPNLATEVALLDDMGIEAPPAFKAAMEEQLANGQATALAHLVLANQSLKAGKFVVATKHLEISLKQAPNNPVALNNLSLALALADAKNAEQSEELIGKAIAIDPHNAEFYDTQGQIRMIAGHPLDALESLEKAIGINPKRINTRLLMVKAYREAGLTDLATAQEKAVTKLQAEAALNAKAASTAVPTVEQAPPVPSNQPTEQDEVNAAESPVEDSKLEAAKSDVLNDGAPESKQ